MAVGDNSHRVERWSSGALNFGGQEYPVAAGVTTDDAPVGIGGYLTEGERYVIFWEKGEFENVLQTSLESTYDRLSKNRVVVAELTVPSNTVDSVTTTNFNEGNEVQIDIKADGQVSNLTNVLHIWKGNDALPAYSFNGDPDTGMYSDTDDQIQFSAGGTQRLEISSAGITVTGAMASSTVSSGDISSTSWFRGDVGTISAPEFSFSVDTDTGIYRSAADALALTAGGESLSLTGAIRTSDSVHFLGLAPTNVMDGTDGDAWIGIGSYPTTSDAYNTRPIHTINSNYHYGAWTGSAASPTFTYWYDNHTGIYFPSDNVIAFTTNGVAKWSMTGTGQLLPATDGSGGAGYDIGSASYDVGTVYAYTYMLSSDLTSTGTALVRTIGGQIIEQTSSIRNKDNVETLDFDSSKLDILRPVSYTYKLDDAPDIGLIAEEVNEVYPELIIYDKEGKPKSVKYHSLSVMLLDEVKTLRKEVKELKEKN